MSVIALAGRRIDAPDAEISRFSLESVPLVAARVRALFARVAPAALVCSAACGGDLIALEVADAAGVPAHIILPFEPDRFAAESVLDRPGSWQHGYDRALARARARGRLEIIVGTAATNDAAYAAASDRILEHALELGDGAAGILAVAVWEGRPRGDDDVTWRLLREAERRGAATESISTLPENSR